MSEQAVNTTSGIIYLQAGDALSQPAGVDTQVQFNVTNAFGGDAKLTWTKGSSTILVNGTLNTAVKYQLNGVLAISATPPTISSGFGTGAAIANSNGSVCFTIDVGTSSASTGVISLPTAPNGWAVQCTDITTNSTTVFITKQTATSTSSATIGNFTDIAGAAAWPDHAIISCIAFPY